MEVKSEVSCDNLLNVLLAGQARGQGDQCRANSVNTENAIYPTCKLALSMGI